MRLFTIENNQYNQLNRFFFHLTPSGVLLMIFSAILVGFLFWFFIFVLYKKFIAKPKFIQKFIRDKDPSNPKLGYSKINFYLVGFDISLLPVVCILAFIFTSVFPFSTYVRELKTIDSLQRKNIFEQYESKVVVTGNYRYSNYTNKDVENVFLVLEKKDKSSFYPNPDYFKPAERIKYSIRSIGERGFVVTETRDIKPIFPFTYHKFFINKEEAPEVYQKILKYKKEIELKNEREN